MAISRLGPLTVILAILASHSSCTPLCAAEAASDPVQQKPPDFPAPICLGSGLRQTEKGFYVGDQPLPLDPPPSMLARAAFYPTQGYLVTVSRRTAVTLYTMKDGKLVPARGKTDSPVAELGGVHFTRIPGLLYLLWIDTAKAAELKDTKRQEYADRYERVALTPEAETYDAMPSHEGETGILTGCYKLDKEKPISFSLKEGSWGELELAEPLGAPFRSGPGNSLAQCIFVFPQHGIVCRTQKGWSVNRLDGSLTRHFPAGHVEAMWWADPTVEDGAFLVHARFGSDGSRYRLDVETGELMKVAKK